MAVLFVSFCDVTECGEYQIRKWSDTTGLQSTQARFVSFDEGMVVLLKPQDKTIRVAFDRLSSADRDYVSAAQAAIQVEPSKIVTAAQQAPTTAYFVAFQPPAVTEVNHEEIFKKQISEWQAPPTSPADETEIDKKARAAIALAAGGVTVTSFDLPGKKVTLTYKNPQELTATQQEQVKTDVAQPALIKAQAVVDSTAVSEWNVDLVFVQDPPPPPPPGPEQKPEQKGQTAKSTVQNNCQPRRPNFCFARWFR